MNFLGEVDPLDPSVSIGSLGMVGPKKPHRIRGHAIFWSNSIGEILQPLMPLLLEVALGKSVFKDSLGKKVYSIEAFSINLYMEHVFLGSFCQTNICFLKCLVPVVKKLRLFLLKLPSLRIFLQNMCQSQSFNSNN